MDPQYVTINSVSLNNNCPECYSREGLTLTFKQRFKLVDELKYFKNYKHQKLCPELSLFCSEEKSHNVHV